ncbi:MAG: ISAs1 family transposase, partial [Chloroflexota bacterium]|nr:ISAs1 family transposase [Chloroflexota bacterium]
MTHPRGPSQATFSRVFATLDVAALEAALAGWAREVLAALCATPPPAPAPAPALQGLALDGKTLRGSAHCTVPGQHLLSAVAHQWGVVLAQQAVDGKTNAITVAPPLLAGLVLTGRVVTADALLTQREIATTIVAAGGDYLLAVKENQPTLAADMRDVFAARSLLADTIQEAYEARLAGNRLEQRALQASTALV